MANLGASVTGIDASEKNIKVASIHSKKNNLKLIISTNHQNNLMRKKNLI